MRALLCALLLLPAVACKRDPQFFGYWDIDWMERDGVRQSDAGFFEIDDRSEVALFLRYRWTGTEFVPDKRPEVSFGASDAKEQDDIIESYKQKGETYALTLSFWGTLDVQDYGPNSATLLGKDTTWPGRPLEELGTTRLRLSR